ncbi:hypothetical protein SAMN06269185_0613 [Natronoarchaeum philippinense]|uniref:Rubrerythrin-like domain-containing protein n=1 Tax=Natronoarchaeum philippinense TaxID=558529 RepID=A0A285N573_NATPI|nr:hypothetical protein [Natronoarchaeum philippinense]SNZ04592.1 hypothetical protein SAMN06269185_0613 [Natronoarchaeum philippinense]
MGLVERLRSAVGGHSDGRLYECGTCEETFAYAPSVDNPTCPYCDAELRATEVA